MIKLSGLPLPCPVNRLYRAMPIPKNGRYITINVLSARARSSRKVLVVAIHQQLGGRPEPLTGKVQVSYTVTPRDKRTPDVDAYEKSLLDGLQHAGVIENDKQVVQVSKERLEPAFPGHLDVEIWEVP